MKNFENIKEKISVVIDQLADNEGADVARLKELNNAAKILILNNTKVLSYNQFMKKSSEKIDYFEKK